MFKGFSQAIAYFNLAFFIGYILKISGAYNDIIGFSDEKPKAVPQVVLAVLSGNFQLSGNNFFEYSFQRFGLVGTVQFFFQPGQIV